MPYYRQDCKHISWFRRVYWVLCLAVAYGGLFFPWLGLVLVPIMTGLTLLGFFRGREWCGNFCDRGALMDGPLRMVHAKLFALPLIRRAPDTVGQIPEVLKHPAVRLLVFAILITFFVSRVIMACVECQDFEGPDFWKKIAMIGSRMWLISVSMVIAMGILFGPRSFCYVCPMGTWQIAMHWIHHKIFGKSSNKCEPLITLVDPDACLKCGQCTRVCPMQLDVHNEFDEMGQLRNVDCIKCGSCVWYCAQQILEFRAPNVNEHPNPRSSPNVPAPAKQATLVDIEDLSGDTRKFKFRTLDGQGLAGGKAGQYALVQVDQKRNVYRAYTISSADPSKEPLEVTVKLDKKGYGTPRLFNLQPGAGVMVVPNLGEDFIPTEEKVKDHVLLMASGVGITPFRSIAYELLERRGHAGKVHLLYSVHGEEDVVYAEEWEDLAAKYPNFEVTILTRHPPAQNAKYERGNVWERIPELGDPERSCAFLCGTSTMVKKSVAALQDAGMPRANIIVENFAKQHSRKVGIAYQRDAPVWLRCNPNYRAKVE